jgi:hypothetical protein
MRPSSTMSNLRYVSGARQTSLRKDHPFGWARLLLGFAGLILTACLCVYPARAQSPAASPTPSPAPSDPCGSILSIVTRPTVTTSTCNVRPGHLLVENGYTNTVTTGPGGGVTVSYPQSFARLGVAPHMEIALVPPSYNRSSAGGTIASGSSDMSFGGKWELGYTRNAIVGANIQVSAPTGDPAFTAGGTQYTANLNWSYTFNQEFGAAGTIGFNSLAGRNLNGEFELYSAFIPSVLFTASLPGGPSELFAEYAYFSHTGPGLPGKSLIDFGYVRDFGANVQFDIEYGIQPTVINQQKLQYWGAGLSFMT